MRVGFEHQALGRSQIVCERIVAGEVKVDKAGKLLAEEEHVVVEQIRVDDAARQVLGE